MNVRYFRAEANIYAAVCAELDAAYGYPSAETKTARALPLASEMPKDAQGRVYLEVLADYCDFVLPVQILTQLLASGAVEEIDKAAYMASLPGAD